MFSFFFGFKVLWVTDHPKSAPGTAEDSRLGRGKNCPLEAGEPCDCALQAVSGVRSTHFAHFIKKHLGPVIVPGTCLILDLAKSHYTASIFVAAFLLLLWLVFLPAKTSISNIENWNHFSAQYLNLPELRDFRP